MTTRVLICDDSGLARKQMAKSLPAGWDFEVSFANNGAEGLEAIKGGKGDILFLDLNMPVMDGYELLEIIKKNDLPTLVIVVSGDIQPEAQQRVKKLGALSFLKKPVNTEIISEIFENYGICSKSTQANEGVPEVTTDIWDCYREISNIAMGRAADLLARMLHVFVEMPVPKVNMIELSDLKMALNHVGDYESISAVCQGFIGSGVAGEALIIFNDSSFTDIASLLSYEDKIDETVELEMLIDISNILIGACIKAIAEQLDMEFSQGHPLIMGRNIKINDLYKRNVFHWEQTLAIEMGLTIEDQNINCDLLLLFTQDSIKPLTDHAQFLMDM